MKLNKIFKKESNLLLFFDNLRQKNNKNICKVHIMTFYYKLFEIKLSNS